MPYLMSHSRVAAFFKTLPVLAGYSLLAFVPTLLGPRQGWLDFRPQLAAFLALTSLAATLGVDLGRLLCQEALCAVNIDTVVVALGVAM